MPKIFDNITLHLRTGLLDTLESSYRADFCVGYFNLRGWKLLMNHVDHFIGEEECCRLLVGMQRPDEDLLHKALSETKTGMMDNPTALALKKEIA
jgi:hypothetical protein